MWAGMVTVEPNRVSRKSLEQIYISFIRPVLEYCDSVWDNSSTEAKKKTVVSHSYRQGSWVRYPVWQHTFVSPSAFSRRAVISYWRKYVHEVLVNRLGGLSLPRKSVVRLTDRPDMTLDVFYSILSHNLGRSSGHHR